MPNWVTNKIKAPSAVISAMLNEQGQVDFAKMAPFPGVVEFDGVYMDAETAAAVALHLPVHEHPLIASLEVENRQRSKISSLSDEAFEQFVGMLRNHRACGYLHSMDFARKVWGTKWNACEGKVDVAAGTAEFDTAWSCPEPVLIKLSQLFPEAQIEVEYADEDIGSNAGTFTLVAGKSTASNIAPRWDRQSEEQRAFWRAFAYRVTGREPYEDEDEGEDSSEGTPA